MTNEVKELGATAQAPAEDENKLVKHKGSVPNRIWSEQNAKTQSYKNIVNYMTNEAKELQATAEAAAEDEE